MPIVAVRNTQTLDQLIGKTYTNLSATQLKAVRAATLAANPHLNEATPLQPGLVVVVPTLSTDAPAASRATDSITGEVAKALTTALGDYRDGLAQRIEGRREESAETAKALKSARFRRTVDGVAGAAELIDSVTSASKTEQAELTEARDFVKKDLDTLTQDLDALFGRIS